MSTEEVTENTSLLAALHEETDRDYTGSVPSSQRSTKRSSQVSSWVAQRHNTRRPSDGYELHSPAFVRSGLRTPRILRSQLLDIESSNSRVWYDQFTSTDWVHDGIADGYRALELRKRKDFRGSLWLIFDAAQAWLLVALIGCSTAAVAYMIDITEAVVFDLKRGYCGTGWYRNRAACCKSKEHCESWRTWSTVLQSSSPNSVFGDYFGFVLGSVAFAVIACLLTLLSKTVIPSNVASTFDENLGAERLRESKQTLDDESDDSTEASELQTGMTYYSAAGSGVAEVKVILSGFVLHGYLGLKTLLLKCPALVFSVASGMSVGKEGPFVHIATCIGNVACRLFPKYNLNDGKRREILSAAAAGGITVAFGSPLGGVLFSLEEVSYYFSPKTLFRTFFCCIAAALSLKFFNPYGTNKIVFFEVRYYTDWQWFELIIFVFLGVMGGLAGALFIKASRIWATTFRRWKVIKSHPWLEVLVVAFVTGVISFWNRYANVPVTELLFELARPCEPGNQTGLCPKTKEEIPAILLSLSAAFLIKAFLTTITFGTKVPAGIYVPSMICGGLMGRIIGHAVQYLVWTCSTSGVFGKCKTLNNPENCITPGVYALVAAGATMCGVTRLSVTLAVILFELTGSLEHVLPFAIGVLTAKWTADFVEPLSIYDLLIDMNSYPYMDNRRMPLFDTNSELGDITPRVRSVRVIDVSISPYVRAIELRAKLRLLQSAGELDGGLPIIREKALVGFIAAPDLEFALDRLKGPEDKTLCLMSPTDQFAHIAHHKRWFATVDNEEEVNEELCSSPQSLSDPDENSETDPLEADLTPFVDPAPVALELHSSLNLVYQCFSKLGLRYICVVEAGVYRGILHKKLFVKYVKTLEAKTE